MQIEIDKAKCIGCGNCEKISKNFILGDDFKARVVDKTKKTEVTEADCPMRAIKITEDGKD